MRLGIGNVFICLTFAATLLLCGESAYAQTLTCGTNGNFGTVNSQATISGPNNMTMSTTGAITYPAVLTGPATGTPITCTLTGGGNKLTYTVECDASRTITNTGGSYGTANRNMTQFRVKGVGHAPGSDLAESTCLGLGTSVGSVKTTVAGVATFTIGTTMDATHVMIGGSYKLSNHATGPVNLQVKLGGVTTGPATADFTVVFAGLMAIANSTGMNFGNMAFTLPLTGADHADLGTNGSIAYAGSLSALAGGAITAGRVQVNNVQNGVTLEIYCDTTATLVRDGGGESIQVTGIKAAAEDVIGSYAGAGAACNGIGGGAATTMVFASGTKDEFFLGGVLDAATAVSFTGNAVYRTSNAGGDDIQIVVLNQ